MGFEFRTAPKALSLAAALVFVIANAIPTGAAEEPDPNVEPPKPTNAWVVNCSTGNTGNKLSCVMVQSLTRKDNGQRILVATIRRQEGSDELLLMLALPHGLFLPDGVAFNVDKGAETKLSIQTSDVNGVYASTSLKPELLAAMKAGSEMKVSMHAVNGQEVIVPLSLSGFTASADKLIATN